jgi:hypothetical protein
MSTHGERLKEFVDLAFTSRREFAEKIGMDENSLGKYMGSGVKSLFGPKYRERLQSLGLNIGWYMSGEGTMMSKAKFSYYMNKKANLTDKVNEDTKDYAVTVYDPISLTAGSIAEQKEKANFFRLPTKSDNPEMIFSFIQDLVKNFPNDETTIGKVVKAIFR